MFRTFSRRAAGLGSSALLTLACALTAMVGRADEPWDANGGYDEPAALLGEIEVVVFQNGALFTQWVSKTEMVGGDPELLSMPTTPWGPAYLAAHQATPGAWDLHFTAGASVPLEWNEQLATHRGSLSGYEVQLHYRPKHSWFVLPGIGLVTMIPICTEGNWTGMRTKFVRPLGTSSDVDWRQFFSLTVSWEGTQADGTPTSGVLPPEVPAMVSGNAGQRIVADGTRVYVDSALPQTPNYDDNFTHGCDNGETSSISDEPYVVLLPWQLAQVTGLPPAGVTLTKIIFHYEFTTYLLVDDEVIYRFDWTHTQELNPNWAGPAPHPSNGQVGGPLPPPGPEYPYGLPSGTEEDGMDADHELAYIRFLQGNFTGAPVQ